MVEWLEGQETRLSLERFTSKEFLQAPLPGIIFSTGHSFEVNVFWSGMREFYYSIRPEHETWLIYEDWNPTEVPERLTFPVEESEGLPSLEQVVGIPIVLDSDELREYATELGAASLTACRTGELESLAEVLVDWHATAEILADEEAVRELQASNDEKGKSWREIRESLPIR